ncbi:MAG: 50S ribosomal protein L25/general stress protein Ctc [Pseudomonadales bacterium]|nr:50S ribosomal protein L25/general stress protein Ctc [Pseudomonadales bacterium]
MSDQIQINAEPRKDVGKGASRRLRRAGVSVPGILYGGGKEPLPITLNGNQLGKAMQNEAFFSQILDVVLEGATEQAVVRDLHRHPATEKVMHIDLMRVRADQVIQVHVPLHFLNEDKCIGVRLGGGNIVHSLSEVEVACLPKDLPEFIAVDLESLNVGDSVHLSDLVLPAGVTLVALVQGADHDLSVVSVRAARGAAGEGASA